MTATVAMYDQSYAHIKDRLDALGLDIEVLQFDREGQFQIGGKAVPPSEVAVDYLWLSNHLNAGGAIRKAFELVLALKSVKVVQTFNAGLDNPVYKQASEKGIRICNSSAQGVAIAEYVMAQVMSVVHPIDLQRKQQAAREWKLTPFRELSRMNWLIIGFGPIGEALATRAKAFGTTIDVVRRSPATSAIVDRAGTMADLPRFLPDADVIVLACSLTEATRGFAGKAFFEAIKPGAVLVNIARGALIDDAELLKALDRGQLATAVLDVFHEEPLPKDNPLWSHPQVRLTPHTSFGGDGGRARWDALFLDNIQRFVKGAPLAFEVNPADIA
jgi:phosphoglycerate dehydrogenase-like enzyme